MKEIISKFQKKNLNDKPKLFINKFLEGNKYQPPLEARRLGFGFVADIDLWTPR